MVTITKETLKAWASAGIRFRILRVTNDGCIVRVS